MKTLKKTETYRATPENVFQCIDADLSISYEKPKGWLNRFLSFLLADWYCNWCLKHMLGDSKKALDSPEIKASRTLQHVEIKG